MRQFVARTTRPIRHAIARRMVPCLYRPVVKPSNPESLVRPTILFIKGTMGNVPLVGAEIGVWTGANAETILRTLNMKMLYLVDPYQPYIESDKLVNPAPKREVAEKRLAPFTTKVHFIHSSSDAVLEMLPNDLDFVYIDANHEYEYVKRDIENYYLKVREKGIIGGHDFSNSFLSIIRAATEFAVSMKLQLMIEAEDWWIIKPPKN